MSCSRLRRPQGRSDANCRLECDLLRVGAAEGLAQIDMLTVLLPLHGATSKHRFTFAWTKNTLLCATTIVHVPY